MSFQSDLKRYKARHYSTAKEIAELLGVSQRTAYRLLSGEKVPSKEQAAKFSAILAKRDPDLFAAAKSILPSGVSDEFFKSCLKQHRDTLADLQMSIKSIQAEQSAQQAEIKSAVHRIGVELNSNTDDITSLWSELRAQKAEIDRLSQRPSLWSRFINFIRGAKNG